MRKSSLPPVLMAVGLLTAFPVLGSAATVMRITIEGVFTEVPFSTVPHPNIHIGDTCFFSADFSDENDNNPADDVYGVVFTASTFLVNGRSSELDSPSGMGLFADTPASPNGPAMLASLLTGAQLNALFFQTITLPGPAPTPVGSTAEFSDFLAFNAINPASVIFAVVNNRGDSIVGNATSFNIAVVPEPGALGLLATASAALFLRRTRRRFTGAASEG